MMTKLRFSFAALALVLLATPAAQAESSATPPPLHEEDGVLVLDRLGHHLTMPMPDWLVAPSGPIATQVELRYLTDARQALVEIRPKGETEALWNTLYGARITLGADQPLTAYRAAVMVGYAATCQPQRTGFFQLTPDTADALAPLGFVCGGYRNDLTGYAGLGEVAIMSFKKSVKGVAIVFQEWRGKAFDPGKPATWPVSTDVVQARASQLQDHWTFATAD